MLIVENLAKELRGDVVGRRSVLVPGPGHSYADRSLSILIDPSAPGGFIVHSFAGDDPLLCREQLGRHGRGSKPSRRHSAKCSVVARRTPAAQEMALQRNNDDCRIEYALSVWGESVTFRGTIAGSYLISRGIKHLPDCMESALRFNPASPFFPKAATNDGRPIQGHHHERALRPA